MGACCKMSSLEGQMSESAWESHIPSMEGRRDKYHPQYGKWELKQETCEKKEGGKAGGQVLV